MEEIDKEFRMGTIVTEMRHLKDAVSGMENTLVVFMAKIEDRLEKKYVTQKEFKPVKKIVNGAVALILTIVLTGVIALVVIN